MYIGSIIQMLKGRMDILPKNQQIDIAKLAIKTGCTENSRDILVPMENNAYRIINADNILYIIELNKGRIFIETLTEQIEFKNTAFDLIEYVDRVHQDFRYLHKCLVVNISKIRDYNSYYRKVYFLGGKEVSVTGKAMDNIVINEVGKEKDLYDRTFNGIFDY